MYDWLGEVSQEVLLAHPAKVRAIAEARIKTDKIDSEMLAHLLRADLIPEAYAPSREVRAVKRVLRQRLFLVRVRTMLKNRVTALLAQHGIERPAVTDLFGRKGLAWLRTVALPWPDDRLLADEDLEHQVLNAVRHREEAQITAQAGGPGRITVATNMAGRGTDIKLGRGVADLGGLHVLATERHEAGRIDRQLFGRAARQGDPGSAGAIVSLEDDLVRRHAPHASAFLRRRYGRTEREISGPLTRGLFNKAQRRAERLALAQRKSVLKADKWLDEYLGFAGRER